MNFQQCCQKELWCGATPCSPRAEEVKEQLLEVGSLGPLWALGVELSHQTSTAKSSTRWASSPIHTLPYQEISVLTGLLLFSGVQSDRWDSALCILYLTVTCQLCPSISITDWSSKMPSLDEASWSWYSQLPHQWFFFLYKLPDLRYYIIATQKKLWHSTLKEKNLSTQEKASLNSSFIQSCELEQVTWLFWPSIFQMWTLRKVIVYLESWRGSEEKIVKK